MVDPGASSKFSLGPFRVRNSIASQMFLAVFLIYLAISLFVTIAQAIEIYTRAKDDLTRELQILGSSFQGTIAKALWEFDEESLKSSIDGLQEIPDVLGVSVLDLNSGEVHRSGVTVSEGPSDNGDAHVDILGVAADQPGMFADRITQEFDVSFEIDGRSELVGRAVVYSDNSVVLDRITLSLVIVVASEVFEIMAMWVIFLWVSQRMLGRPLAILTNAAGRLSAEDLRDFKVDIQTKYRNELKLLEEAFNYSAERLSEAKDELEHRMRLALSAGKIATWVWRPEEDVLEFDEHLPSIFGQATADFGNSFARMQQFIHPQDRPGFVGLMNRTIETREPLQTDFRVQSADGDDLFIEVQAIVSQSADDPDTLYMVGTAMDVTDRKQADMELYLAKAAAEQASNAKSQFLASMSHELRTPLNAILGFSEVLKEESLGPIGTTKYREYANDIHNSGSYLLELVGELLDLSAIEAGKIEFERELIQTGDIIEDCIRTIAEKTNAKRIDLSFESEADIPPVFADRRSVKQVMLNVLSNAVKFTGMDGRITIVTKAQDKHVQMVVTDNGVGISEDRLKDITTPFTRGEKSSISS